MPDQDSIPSHKLTRVASLAGAGARLGVNYLKYYGKRSLTGEDRRDELHEQNARDVYQTFSTLKGGPLKLAQMLSIDQGILPDAFRNQFGQAYYSAPPLSYPLVVRTFRREFGRSPEEMFDRFSSSAAHGASIGQVHQASKGGRDFAVKVQYPGVADSLSSDLAVVKPIALRMFGLREEDLRPYFKEVEERLLEETDYHLELERSLELSSRCDHLPGLRFPSYYPEYSSRRILTMEWMNGLPLDRFADSDVAQEERDRIGQTIWDFYHHQVHVLGRFHADPHPGNFLIAPDGAVVVLDFGCTKAIPPAFRRSYFKLLDHETLDDPDRFEESLEHLGILRPSDASQIRGAILESALVSTRLLARPFHTERFDFGDSSYMSSIVAMGETNRKNAALMEAGPARGSADSLYLNRAYFGLYSLMGRLRARVCARIPDDLDRAA